MHIRKAGGVCMNVKSYVFKFILLAFMLMPVFAFAGIENADVNKVEEYIKSGKYIVVDVRKAEEFAAGHIKGAGNIDYYNDDFETLFEEKYTDKNQGYILYCRSGMRSQYSAEILEELGYTNLVNMTGGFLSWQDAGKPVEK